MPLTNCLHIYLLFLWRHKTLTVVLAFGYVYHWPVGRGLSFKSGAGQIEHSIANGSPPQQHFIERSCVARAQ